MAQRDDRSVASKPAPPPAANGALRDAGQFARHLLRRFVADGCLERASALSFTTVLSLVPVAAISLAFLSAVPASGRLRVEVEELLASYLLPHASQAVVDVFRTFVGKARGLTGFGFVGLAVTALMLLATINSTFDTIWRVTRPRPLMIRLLAYWAILTVGPLLLGGALSLSGVLLATGERYGGSAFTWSMGWITPLVPLLLQFVAFTVLYYVAPNRRVPWRDAACGGIVAALLFEAAKRGLGLYIVWFPTYDAIYGALAAIPVVLVWIYLCWTAIRLGAEVAAAMAEWRARDKGENATG